MQKGCINIQSALRVQLMLPTVAIKGAERYIYTSIIIFITFYNDIKIL